MNMQFFRWQNCIYSLRDCYRLLCKIEKRIFFPFPFIHFTSHTIRKEHKSKYFLFNEVVLLDFGENSDLATRALNSFLSQGYVWNASHLEALQSLKISPDSL
jgi:hypothetical protein